MKLKAISLLAVLAVVAAAQAACAEPIRVAKANFSLRDPARAAVPAIPAPSAGPVTVDVADEAALRETMQSEMLQFVRRNYPSHAAMATRSLQNGEGQVHEELAASMKFLKEFAAGPVTIEGAFREIRGVLRYVVTGTLSGVNGNPNAILRFETYPGMFRPVTDVTVDQNGDGKADEKSTAFCRLDRVWEWVEARFPQNAKLARAISS